MSPAISSVHSPRPTAQLHVGMRLTIVMLIFVALRIPAGAAEIASSDDRSVLTAGGDEERSIPRVDTATTVKRGGPRPLDTIWSDIKTSFIEAPQIYGRPLDFSGRDWMWTGIALGGTAMISTVDEEIRDAVLDLHGSTGDAIADFGNFIGRNMSGVAVFGALYGTGLLFDSPRLRIMGRHVIQALLYSALINETAKRTFGRHRPFHEHGQYVFNGPWEPDDPYLSLPSGHTTVAFSVLSSLAADIENPWVSAGLYSVASIAAFSRVYSDRHWTSDVVLAASLASAIGYGVANLGERDEDSTDESSFYILPGPGTVTVGWRW